MRSILDRSMERNLNISRDEADRLGNEYIQRLDLANALFDGKPFRLLRDEGDRPSESMYDAVMLAVDRLWKDRETLLASKGKIQNLYWKALDTPEKIERFSGRANTASDVKARIDAMEQLFIAAIARA
jgi:hypothetical protein